MRDSEAPSIADVSLFSGRLLAEFYAERDYQNAWDAARARAMLALARSSRADGFDPEDFHAKSIAKVLDADQLGADSEAQRTAADILLSDALLRYVHHFRFGKYNPRFINSGQTFVGKADAESLKADMEQVLAAPDLAAEVTALLPDPPFYRNLKLGYQRYLAIADRGGWGDIPAGGNLTIGSKDPRVPLIREHLEVIDGYEPAAIADPERYDEALAEAIKGFQRRSGLAADGVVGPATLRALNQPLDDRLLAIRANLERMRWLYDDLPDGLSVRRHHGVPAEPDAQSRRGLDHARGYRNGRRPDADVSRRDGAHRLQPDLVRARIDPEKDGRRLQPLSGG